MKKFLKNNLKIVIILGVIIAVAFTGFVFAFADQENELEFCDHEYTVTAFSGGVATICCSECGDTDTLVFAEYLNSRDCEELDMNHDGIVNAQDYAILIRNFSKQG